MVIHQRCTVICRCCLCMQSPSRTFSLYSLSFLLIVPLFVRDPAALTLKAGHFVILAQDMSTGHVNKQLWSLRVSFDCICVQVLASLQSVEQKRSRRPWLSGLALIRCALSTEASQHALPKLTIQSSLAAGLTHLPTACQPLCMLFMAERLFPVNAAAAAMLHVIAHCANGSHHDSITSLNKQSVDCPFAMLLLCL